jgi:hypothetical protein
MVRVSGRSSRSTSSKNQHHLTRAHNTPKQRTKKKNACRHYSPKRAPYPHTVAGYNRPLAPRPRSTVDMIRLLAAHKLLQTHGLLHSHQLLGYTFRVCNGWTEFTVSIGKRNEHPRGMALVTRMQELQASRRGSNGILVCNILFKPDHHACGCMPKQVDLNNSQSCYLRRCDTMHVVTELMVSCECWHRPLPPSALRHDV